ncbi:SGT1 protein-domain-containing protein [Dipodascopsis uninucleata]
MEIFSALSDLPDDTADYSIYWTGDGDAETKKCKLRKLKHEIFQLIDPWIKDYIWQRQGFNLNLVKYVGDWRLHGVTEFGDCIEDEWFLVFILREISKKFDNVAIKIIDGDGEFLLIEASNAIPRWLNPENADNRVWIYRGHLGIISKSESNPNNAIAISEALEVLRNDPQSLYRPPLLQQEAFARLKAYPEAAKRNTHKARVVLPRRLAQLLHKYPNYITAAAEAFLLRDPISMRVCNKMSRFPPSDSVLCTVKFTRLVYAQLKSQRIKPPPVFNIPNSNSEGYAEAELGMKVACGFEILCSGAGKKSSEREKKRDLTSDPRFKEYMNELERENFFGNEKHETPTYQRLVKQAEQTFREVVVGDAFSSTMIGEEITKLLDKMDSLPSDEEISLWDSSADSDSWLDMEFGDFEKMLDGEDDSNGPKDVPDAVTQKELNESQEKLKSIVQRLRQFMDDEEAGLDGVEFDDDPSSDDDIDTMERIKEIDDENEGIDETGEVNEDEFLEFFLSEALKLSPEQIEQFRADSKPDQQEIPPEGESSDSRRIRDELLLSGVLNGDEEDDNADQVNSRMIADLLDSIRNHPAGSGPAATLLSRLGFGDDNEGNTSNSGSEK